VGGKPGKANKAWNFLGENGVSAGREGSGPSGSTSRRASLERWYSALPFGFQFSALPGFGPAEGFGTPSSPLLKAGIEVGAGDVLSGAVHGSGEAAHSLCWSLAILHSLGAGWHVGLIGRMGPIRRISVRLRGNVGNVFWDFTWWEFQISRTGEAWLKVKLGTGARLLLGLHRAVLVGSERFTRAREFRDTLLRIYSGGASCFCTFLSGSDI